MMRGRGLVNRLAVIVAALLAAAPLHAEDGYALWLRHAPLEGEALAALRAEAPIVPVIVDRADSPTLAIAETELRRGIAGLQGHDRPRLTADSTEIILDCGTTRGDGAAGFVIAPERIEGRRAVRIAAADHVGCLYGSFALLRALGEGTPLSEIRRDEAPAMPLRMLDHWDNPDGHVERGYAGRSIIDWWHLPDKLDPRLVDYARANASIGINAVAVNNVNAKAFMLEPRYIARLARLADAWRPYGIRVFLSARFSAPMELGGLPTADPRDPAVKAWWQAKADEIYAAIPDFGGFLVKANSEGQPGPQDYGRSHAEGANMLAAALGDRGTVIWRAFVYSPEDTSDRTAQAYAEFQPLDGQFALNVILQVKNGALDFQPREPFHPLFGAMPRTRVMLEAQITREYLGQASGIAYLAPLWKEVLEAQTGRGGSVAQITAPVGMAGVANVGSDRNWTGTHFDAANWYAFGRLAWNPALSSEDIAREWAAQTFTRDDQALGTIAAMMLGSRETVVDYTGPLGLAHLMGTGHHYGPAPWVCDLGRADWNPCYYHRADKGGIGFDRTAAGSKALAQYAPAIAANWSDPATTDPRYLLWFHHLPWSHRLPSGRTLWEELAARYDAGVAGVDRMAAAWASLAPAIDAERHAAITADLAIQRKEARWWRDASLAYWQSVNGLALPPGTAPPAEPLAAYKLRAFPEAPGQ
ncbi:alpha-glucuronidase family glycosyl hydrolase [Erythrobacter colymbi]|uniref:alpha-glucuronidase family glycosyl hydrolase n=1 Tax=Erythrobacter colymbi TaxID=1161202 RepID=UPI000A399550|nr:alpha-glucuronidase family glycosyl hydrolase [Erythrobacter colymbi]